jgi:hypothetical protein
MADEKIYYTVFEPLLEHVALNCVYLGDEPMTEFKDLLLLSNKLRPSTLCSPVTFEMVFHELQNNPALRDLMLDIGAVISLRFSIEGADTLINFVRKVVSSYTHLSDNQEYNKYRHLIGKDVFKSIEVDKDMAENIIVNNPWYLFFFIKRIYAHKYHNFLGRLTRKTDE